MTVIKRSQSILNTLPSQLSMLTAGSPKSECDPPTVWQCVSESGIQHIYVYTRLQFHWKCVWLQWRHSACAKWMTFSYHASNTPLSMTYRTFPTGKSGKTEMHSGYRCSYEWGGTVHLKCICHPHTIWNYPFVQFANRVTCIQKKPFSIIFFFNQSFIVLLETLFLS